MANDVGCPIIVGDFSAGMVSNAYDKYTQYATNAYNMAVNQANALANFQLTPIAISVHFQPAAALTGYVRPTAPSIPDIEYNAPAPVPDAPTLQVTPVQLDPAPTDPALPVPQFAEYAAPGALDVVAPGAPVLADVVVPTAPDIELPPVPTLQALQLPDAPSIQIPTFDGVRPSFNIAAPQGDFSFTPEQYVSALLDKARGTVSGMLDGGTGLPLSVVQALRDRADGEADKQQAQAEQEAFEDYASRGFQVPAGVLNRRLAEVRQAAQNRKSTLNRDIFVQEQQVAIENLRFAVTQGIALESTLIQAHSEEMRLALSAATFARDTAVSLFNARVTLANTEMQAYQIDASVWRSQIEGELATLEVYKAQLQAAQVRGELNVQQVQIYSERIRAVSVQADLYRTEMQGAQAQAAVNESVAAAYRAQIEGYSEAVKAYGVQWDAYRSQLASNETRARIYEIVEGAYATRVKAWSDRTSAKLSAQTGDIQAADLRLRAWRGKVDTVLAQYGAERDRVAALVSIAGSKVDLYRASAQVESAASDANARQLSASIAQEGARVDTELKNADAQIRQMEADAQLLLAARREVASVSAQLAASSMSAVNFSVGTHSSLGQSYGCSTSFNYSGQIDPSTA